MRIEQITIGAGKTLHLELENGARVGNNYEANASNLPYFLVEPWRLREMVRLAIMIVPMMKIPFRIMR